MPSSARTIQGAVKAVGIAGLDQHRAAVFGQARFDHVILLKHLRGQHGRTVGANQHLHGMLLNLAADALDLAFGDDVAVAQRITWSEI